MQTRPIYLVDAFTRVALRGNPAGVMPHARGLDEDQMLAIAREVNASETAFVLPSREADFRIRFFTPAQEVPSCGHALVAALTVLEDLGEIRVPGEFGRVRVETGVGVLPADLVRTAEGIRVDLTQDAPAFRPCTVAEDRVLEALGADEDDLRTDLPLELAYTGLWHLLVPLTTTEALDGLLPDYRALAALSEELGVLTVHVFVEGEGGYHCRDFSPAAGIDEDPVTGTASGALGAYLVRHRAATPGTPLRMVQGEACARPGEVRVVIQGTPGRPERVVVGGHAVVSLRGHLRLGDLG
ncbi:MAG: PhzF family phenazine biosynthesis isomerase [Deltaproteobacteria bacterium]|nr:PhzF family phenazine biosynthesis isomerase [Deltaproteobacteria bacterium]